MPIIVSLSPAKWRSDMPLPHCWSTFLIKDVKQPNDDLTVYIQLFEPPAYGKPLPTVGLSAGGDSPQNSKQQREVTPDTRLTYTNDSHKKLGSGLGCLLIIPEGTKTKKSLRIRFNVTNNEVEYEAAIDALKVAHNMRDQRKQLFTYSKLLSMQFGGIFEDENERMRAYLNTIRSLTRRFTSIEITQKPENDVRYTNSLAYLAAAIKVD